MLFHPTEALLSQPQDTIGDFDGPVALLGQDCVLWVSQRGFTQPFVVKIITTNGSDLDVFAQVFTCHA